MDLILPCSSPPISSPALAAMDTHALLAAQGWRGSGHTLNPHSDSIGLSRPILVSKKQNSLGVGTKHKTSDLWWMNAFDKTLKGLDTTQDGKVVQTVTNGGLDMVAKGGRKFVGGGGIYDYFVRGESLSGTLTPEEPAQKVSSVADEAPPPKKQNSRRLLEDAEMKQAERRARKASRRAERDVTKPLKPAADERHYTSEKRTKKKKRRKDL